MGSGEKDQIFRVFEQINVLEEEKGSPLSLNDVAEEISPPTDPMSVLELFERMNLVRIRDEGSELELTDFAKGVLELPPSRES